MKIDRLLGEKELKDYLAQLKAADEKYLEAEMAYQQSFADLTTAREERIKVKEKLMKYLEEYFGTKL